MTRVYFIHFLNSIVNIINNFYYLCIELLYDLYKTKLIFLTTNTLITQLYNITNPRI